MRTVAPIYNGQDISVICYVTPEKEGAGKRGDPAG